MSLNQEHPEAPSQKAPARSADSKKQGTPPEKSTGRRHAGKNPKRPRKEAEEPAPQTPLPPPAPETKKDRQKFIRALLAAMSVLLLLVIMIASLSVYQVKGHNQLTVFAPLLGSRPYFSWGNSGDAPDTNEIRETVLFHVSNMGFSPANLLKYLSGTEAVPVFYNVDQRRLYCAIPRNRFNGVADFNRLTDKPEYIERGKRVDDRLVLGEYHLKDVNSVFFSFPVDDLLLLPDASISIGYPSASYVLSLSDLVQYFYNRNMYGSFYVTQCRTNPERTGSEPIQLPAFVVYPGEPSLSALIQQLLGEELSIEKRTQRLLDFVTKEIRPDSDLVKSCDKIKKVDEILITGSCGLLESVILYASLLEQTEIDYLIVYNDGAAAILVEGDYPLQRGALVLHINGKSYHLADPTQRGFIIGQPSGPAWKADKVLFIQRAGINSKTFSVETGKPSI